MTAPSKIAAQLASKHNMSMDDVRSALLGHGNPFDILAIHGALDEQELDDLRSWAEATTPTLPDVVARAVQQVDPEGEELATRLAQRMGLSLEGVRWALTGRMPQRDQIAVKETMFALGWSGGHRERAVLAWANRRAA